MYESTSNNNQYIYKKINNASKDLLCLPSVELKHFHSVSC